MPEVGEQDADDRVLEDIDIDLRELYFLILHFLANGPCQQSFDQLWKELSENELLPRRYHAWYSRSGRLSGHVNDDGISFPLSYDKLVERNPHIRKDHLLKLLKQLMLNVAPSMHSMERYAAPSAADVPTLLGVGDFSLVMSGRTEVNSQAKPPAYLRWPHSRANQVHGLNLREIGGGFTKHHRAPSIRHACYAVAKPSIMVQRMQNIKRLRGHRAAVYCAIFDRSGRYVITGSDDRLVKIWSMETAFCLASCRGHEGDITDLAVSSNNVMVASASNDYSIRVWLLPDGRPISVLRGHTGAVTAIAFSPRPGFQLLSSSDDGTCRIWDAKNPKSSPQIYRPKPTDTKTGNKNGTSSAILTSSDPPSHQILCCAFNATGSFFVTGSSDTIARVWNACKVTDNFEQPIHEVDILAGHENDVNYVQFSGCAVAPKFSSPSPFTEDTRMKFKNSWFSHDSIVTCSRDGSAIIWIPRTRRFHSKAGRWMQAYHLKVPPPPLPPQPPRGGPRRRLLPTPRGVNMIVWSLDNRFVLAAIMDCRICVWNASDGSLVHCLTGHTESTYVLDVHPFNPRIAMSAGYDGKTIVWDIWEGTPIMTYKIGRFKLVDGKFSQDGTSIVLSDEVGQVCLLNTGEGESQKDAQYDQFFLGDYRPLTQDTQGNVVDQETQLVPYRRNIQDCLCDGSMIPYPEPYQSMFQKRRLSALGIDWHPPSIKFAIGTDIGLGEEILPLADLDTLFEPIPYLVETLYLEPDIEAINGDTDSEYNLTDEDPTESERGSLSSYSLSDSEYIEDCRNVHIRGKKRKTDVLIASSGKHNKRRNLDQCGGSISRNKRNKQKSANTFSRRKSSRAKSLVSQRFARIPRGIYAQIIESSTDGDDEVSSADGSSESEIQPDYSVKHPESSRPHVNRGNDRKLVFKFSLRDSKKLLSSENSNCESAHMDDLIPSSSIANQEASKDNQIVLSSDVLVSCSAKSTNVLPSGECAGTQTLDNHLKIDSHLKASSSHKRIKIRFGKGKMQSLNGINVNMEGQRNHGAPQIDDFHTEDAHKLLLYESASLNDHQPSTVSACDEIHKEKHKNSSGLDAGKDFQLIRNVSQCDEPENQIKPTKLRIKLNSKISVDNSARGLMDCSELTEFKGTLGNTDAASHILNVRKGFQLEQNSRNEGKLPKRELNQISSNEWMSNSEMSVRSSAIQSKRYVHCHNDPLVVNEGYQPPQKANWLMLSVHEDCSYVPQLGDEVAYLRQGHQEYIEKMCLLEEGPWIRLKKEIRSVEFCLVERLDYATFPGSGDSCCKITLKFMDPSSCVYGENFKFTLSELTGFADFVVERTWYDATMKRNWTSGDKCQVLWKELGEIGKWWEGTIVACKDKSNEFPESPWERYSVVYKDGPDTFFHSPWELHDPNNPWLYPHIDYETRDKLLSCFNYLNESINQDHYGILKLRNVARKSDYMNGFSVPLSLDLINFRLREDYYRRLEAVKHDINVALSNAYSYFRKDTRLTAKLRSLSKWFSEQLCDL
ncbi:bromodomain and WD repeat-containing protein 3-like [Impatiens glandulifera]|uniref:bromodomain and WD repeat-containing protein 3-like n=1 Tax=Impatiens glandulifera TaxID=253017 RepID=UPI001FB14FF0|nr:bromodomain and WD repeat-containing protein 3-like [Impatiens glandulifera]XP_047315949.1 bromodomain and WD repeat-containing protein 3-like [Impatiens glandulifera]